MSESTATGNQAALCETCPIRDIMPFDPRQYAAECVSKYAYYSQLQREGLGRSVVAHELEKDFLREDVRAPIMDCINNQQADGCFNSQ